MSLGRFLSYMHGFRLVELSIPRSLFVLETRYQVG